MLKNPFNETQHSYLIYRFIENLLVNYGACYHQSYLTYFRHFGHVSKAESKSRAINIEGYL